MSYRHGFLLGKTVGTVESYQRGPRVHPLWSLGNSTSLDGSACAVVKLVFLVAWPSYYRALHRS